jgi:hypothetical protein
MTNKKRDEKYESYYQYTDQFGNSKTRKVRRNGIMEPELVAQRIKQELENAQIKSKAEIIERIIHHERECSKFSKESIKRSSIPDSTLYNFLNRFNLDTIKWTEGKRKKNMPSMPSQSSKLDLKKEKSLDHIINSDDDADDNKSTLALTEENLERCLANKDIPLFDQFLTQDADQNQNNLIIHYQGEKIRELTKICCGLSNKIPPSSMVSLCSSATIDKEDDVGENIIELEQSRSLHLCIRAFIQVLSPIKKMTEWIIENVS